MITHGIEHADTLKLERVDPATVRECDGCGFLIGDVKVSKASRRQYTVSPQVYAGDDGYHYFLRAERIRPKDHVCVQRVARRATWYCRR